MSFDGQLEVFCDGGARGNPGPAAIGVVILDDKKKKITELSQTVGLATNNVAEYKAVIHALKYLLDEFKTFRAVFNLDSELVVKQLNGEYKVKDENLRNLYFEVRQLLFESGGSIVFQHIFRTQNKAADELVNRALDEV